MAEQYTTLGSSTLSSNYTAASGSLVVSSASSFPAGPTFRVRFVVSGVGGAVYKVTAVSGTTYSVTLESGSDVNVTSGATVIEVLTGASLDQIRADICQSDVIANLPASSKAGILYLPTDAPVLARDSGAAFGLWGPIAPSIVAPPAYSSLTWVDQGGATGDSNGGVLTLNAPFATGDNLRMLVKSLVLVGGAESTFTVGMLTTAFAVNYANVGIVMRESGTGKLASFSLGYSGVGLYYSYCMNAWNSATSYNAALATPVASMPSNFAFGLWLRMIYTVSGSTLTFQVSGDGGKSWYTILVYSIGAGVPFTTAPDQIGIFIDTANNTYGQTVSVFHWVES